MASHPVFERQRIFAPGPTPVPQEVLSELAKAPLHHRTQDFISIFERVRENLRFLFQTRREVYVLASSGTGAMEASIVNLFSAGDEVLVIDGGKFGERWGVLANRYGLKVQTLKVEWGEAADPEKVREMLRTHRGIRAILLQASETSTGVAHPVKAIAEVARAEGDALIVVDAITALGVSELPMDEWGLDVVITGSQKALMLPPGLAFLALSERAGERRKNAKLPGFYFNLQFEDKALASGETAWTPAVGLIMGLDVVLAAMRKSGLAPIFRYYQRLSEATRRGCRAIGLELFAKHSPSNAVTAVRVPASISEGGKIVSSLRDHYAITIAGGQDAWKGKMFRLAHLGFYDELDMLTILSAVELTLKRLGAEVSLGKGVGAAAEYLLQSEAGG